MPKLFRRTSSRRSSRSALAVFAAIMLVAGCSGRSQAVGPALPVDGAPAGGQPIPVAIIGDSYTAGTDAGGLGEANWTAVLERNAAAAMLPLQLTVSGRRGSGYLTAGGEGTTFLTEARRIVSADDRVVIVFGSRNDADADVTAAAEATFAEIEQKAPHARVIAIAPPPTNSEVPPFLKNLGDAIRGAAARKDVIFVDTIGDGWFSDAAGLIGTDGWHPSDDGHRYMADKITPVVLAALRP